MLNNKRELKWVLLGIPVLFILRRVIFIINVLFMSGYLWAQLLLQTVLSAAVFSFYQHF